MQYRRPAQNFDDPLCHKVVHDPRFDPAQDLQIFEVADIVSLADLLAGPFQKTPRALGNVAMRIRDRSSRPPFAPMPLALISVRLSHVAQRLCWSDRFRQPSQTQMLVPAVEIA
jgi:hypothetical protein